MTTLAVALKNEVLYVGSKKYEQSKPKAPSRSSLATGFSEGTFS